MFKLTTTPYLPTEEEITILKLLSEGKTQKQIAKELNIEEDCLRQRTCQLRLKLGAKTNEQMMSHYGIYKERNKKL